MLHLIIKQPDSGPRTGVRDWYALHTNAQAAHEAWARLELNAESAYLVEINDVEGTYRVLNEAHAANGSVVTDLVNRIPERRALLPEIQRGVAETKVRKLAVLAPAERLLESDPLG